jgi:hypothetical protein
MTSQVFNIAHHDEREGSQCLRGSLVILHDQEVIAPLLLTVLPDCVDWY